MVERSKQSKQSKNGAKKVLRKKRSKALLKYEVEHAAVEGLKPHPRNYRTHPEDQLAHLVASIEEHGFYRNERASPSCARGRRNTGSIGT